MSSGAFLRTQYEDDNGGIRAIRVQPETEALTVGAVANAAPVADPDTKPRAKVTGSLRSYGVHARLVTIVFETGDAPAGYEANQPIRLPWLKKATFAGIQDNQIGSYLGKPCRVISTRPEKIR